MKIKNLCILFTVVTGTPTLLSEGPEFVEEHRQLASALEIQKDLPKSAEQCSQEGSNVQCYCDGEIWYGAQDKWIKKTSSAKKPLNCDNRVFTDPIIGVVKTCQCVSSQQDKTTSVDYSYDKSPVTTSYDYTEAKPEPEYSYTTTTEVMPADVTYMNSTSTDSTYMYSKSTSPMNGTMTMNGNSTINGTASVYDTMYSPSSDRYSQGSIIVTENPMVPSGTVKIEQSAGFKGKGKVDGMRLKFMNYFYYALATGTKFSENDLGKCEDVCSKWNQKCCASVTLTNWEKETDLTYQCINQAVADVNVNMKLDDFSVSMKCDNTWSGAQRLQGQVLIGAAIIAAALY